MTTAAAAFRRTALAALMARLEGRISSGAGAERNWDAVRRLLPGGVRPGCTRDPGPAGYLPLPAPSARDDVTGAAVDPARPLLWRRSLPLSSDFELRQGERLFGEMETAVETGMDATGECLGRTLALRSHRSLLGTIRVETVRGSDAPGPSFRGRSWRWGRVTTLADELLRWRPGFTGLYTHVLVDGVGVRLLTLRPTFLRFGRTETKVVADPRFWRRDDAAELLLLTWFLRAHAEVGGRKVFKRR